MDRTDNWRVTLLACLLLAAVTLVVFWPILHHDFLNYDDAQYVTENPHVLSGLTWDNVRWALSAGYASNWHPLTWVSHMLDVQLFGLKPGWHHLTNLLLHTANVVLLFLLLRRMTSAFWRSAVVAGLFALHPLHVESVAWVAERKDVLSALFFFLTLWAYVSYAQSPQSTVHSPQSEVRDQEPRAQRSNPEPTHETRNTHHVSRITHHASRSFYVLSLLFFALGLMSKPMLVTLPFVLLLLDYWPLGRLAPHKLRSSVQRVSSGLGFRDRLEASGTLIREKLPFFALSAASCVVTCLVQNEAMVNPAGLPLVQRLGNAAMACLAYLRQTVWPEELAIFYPYPLDLSAAKAVAASALLLALTVAALLLARRQPYAPVGWLWFLGMLVPVIGIVQVGAQARADRYTYLPSIGIFILSTWGAASLLAALARYAARIRPNLLISPGETATTAGKAVSFTAAVIVLAALGLAAHRQVQYWRNSESVFAHAAQTTEDNYVALTGLGIVDLRRGDYAKAMTNLVRALECARTHGAAASIKYYLGAALQMQGKGLEALPYLQEAVVGPDLLAERNCRLGVCLIEAGRLPEAEAAIRQALAAKPYSPDFQMALAALLQKQGQTAKAEQIFRDLIATHPELAKVHQAFADFLVQLGRPGEAEVEYAAAIKSQPVDAGLLRAYASTLARLDKPSEAIRQLQKAVQVEPANAQANFELAELLSQQGRSREALGLYDRALEADPKQVSALNNLAWLLATHPDEHVRNGPRAVELAERACRLTDWKAPLLLGTLAAAQAEAGRFADAIAMAEKARDLARAANQESTAKRNEELLELYKSGRAYHEPPPR